MLRLNAYQYSNTGTFSDGLGNTLTTRFKATVVGLPASVGYSFIQTPTLGVSVSAGVSAMALIGNTQNTTANPSKPAE